MAITPDELKAMQERIAKTKKEKSGPSVLIEKSGRSPLTKKRSNEESKLQKACVQWFRTQYPQHILFAIPNGGKRGVIEASIMKAEGVLAGVPDLFLAVPQQYEDGVLKAPGLFIEMKTPDGAMSDNQKVIMPKLKNAGYPVVICRSFEAFKTAVDDYLMDA